ncbi:hypothetical protein MFIFM68171_09672 [Madurella fahalii]|uniref:Uncharacterized protein n=1 Tax=Madurella fahalii TaxID=1157608 RepID=A0ABQ0GP06_9PEZI
MPRPSYKHLKWSTIPVSEVSVPGHVNGVQEHAKGSTQAGSMPPQRTVSPRRISSLDYKPSPLKWPYLVALTTVMLALIAVVETACHFLPAEADSDLVPGPESKSSSTSPSISAGQSRASMLRFRVAKRSARNNSTTTSSDPTITSPSIPAQITTELLQSSSTSEGNDPGEGRRTSFDTPRIGDPTKFIQPGFQTRTFTFPDKGQTTVTSQDDIFFTLPPEHHGSEGAVTLEPTTVEDVVVTVTKKTTLTGVVTTVTGQTTLSGVERTDVVRTTLNGVESTYSRTTTIDGVPSTFVGTTTLNGVVSTVTTTTTLSNVVSSFSEVRTLGTVVSEYPSATTLHGVVVGVEPSYVTASLATLTDSNGMPTATITSTPSAIYTPTITTLSDGSGAPTATITTHVLATPRTRVLTDSAGAVTATVTEYPVLPSQPSGPQTVVRVYYISKGEYFVGFFLPTLLAVMLTIPIRMIDLAAKQLQPWHALTHKNGASAEESLCLRTGGIYGISSSVRSLAGGQALVFLTTMLTLSSIFLVPLSAEAVSLKLHGSCSKTDFRGCAMTLGVFLAPARATIALLGFMVILMLLIMCVLSRWRSGVTTNPWTIASIASLSTNPGVRAVFSRLPTGRGGRITHQRLVTALDGKTFKLEYFFNHSAALDYGIVPHDEVDAAEEKLDAVSSAGSKSPLETEIPETSRKAEHHLPFLMLSYTGRIAFLLSLTGIMVLILYYNNTGGDTAFERFMSTQNFGVRSLFTLVGVSVTFFWSSFFSSLAVLSPYQLLSYSPQPPQRSITLTPPLNAFSGVWSAVKRRHLFLAIVAFTAILSEFMPILLSNVPFRVTQTWIASRVCNWLAVGILSIMWLVVAGSFFVSWPHMPVDPSTIAGAIYYVCDSWMLWGMEGLSTLRKEERDRKVADLGLKYEFGTMAGLSGRGRVGVESVDGLDDHEGRLWTVAREQWRNR